MWNVEALIAKLLKLCASQIHILQSCKGWQSERKRKRKRKCFDALLDRICTFQVGPRVVSRVYHVKLSCIVRE
jgi:hypothetical protein